MVKSTYKYNSVSNQCLFVSVLVLISIIGCTFGNNNPPILDKNDFRTVQTEKIFEFTESDSLAFQTVSNIQSDGHGNILVTDFRQKQIFMFDSERDLVQVIGNEGSGPGEFRHVGNFYISGEELWVIDGFAMKIEIFRFDTGRYVYKRTLNFEERKLLGEILHIDENQAFLKNQVIFFAAEREHPSETAISVVDKDGKVLEDTLFTIPINEFVADGSGQLLIAGKPFGIGTLITAGYEGEFYTLRTDSLRVDYFDRNGERHSLFSWRVKPVEITPIERDSVLNRWENPTRAELQKQLSDVKPAVNVMVVDNQGRIWLELLTDNLGHGWFAFSNGGEPLLRIEIPEAGANLRDIKDDILYYDYLNQSGAPTIAASKIILE